MGVPASTNAFGLAAQGSGSAVVLNLLFWVALVISIPLRGYNPLYGTAALVGVFLSLAFFGTVILITRGQKRADTWLRRIAEKVPGITPDQVSRLLANVAERITILMSNRRVLYASLGWAAANWLFDAACLWTFLWAFGYPISPIDLMVAYGARQHLGGHSPDPRWSGLRRGQSRLHPRWLRRAAHPGHSRHLELPADQLLAADSRRWARLPLSQWGRPKV
jgi:uncharacterized membrane protein YbhN (UPF0104 family)